MKKRFSRLRTESLSKGFSLVELIVASALFALLAVAVYHSYVTVITLVSASRVKILATDIANEELELIRNLPYSQVGVVSSIPAGVVLGTQTVERNGQHFTVGVTIRNVDDPFDGVIGGVPNDLSPADYKMVHIDIDCETCKNFATMSFVTRVSPKNLETASTNGALFIRVFDANGEPVPQASVSIVNSSATSTITIDDQTDNQGSLQLVDAPPGINVYEIIVSKSGFTSDRTYATTSENQNPTKPHATVLLQQVTQISFVIDELSTVNVSTITDTCAVVPSIPFTMRGAKMVGIPEVYEYDEDHITNSNGTKTISNIEWDTYNLSVDTGTRYLAGVSPLLPVTVLPGAEQDINLILTTKSPRHLLVTVKDNATFLPLSGAAVSLVGGSVSESTLTGRGFITQTDWSGGPGQEIIGDASMYGTSDGNIDATSAPGEIKLSNIFGAFSSGGNLTSSIFDTGTSTNFNQLVFAPTNQPIESGGEPVKFQIATSEDNTASTTWTFIGPDGTSNSYYNAFDSNISSSHNGDRYFRYKALLSTASTTFSPNVSDVSVTFTSACVPPGQVLFDGLPLDTFTLKVSKAGYGLYETEVTTTSSWQQVEVVLIPQ